MKTPIVQLQQFIQAIRDAGYRGTGSAVAELVDNAFEAGADNVEITVGTDPEESYGRVIIVADNGCGMSPAVLKLALQFGGSSHFSNRTGTGRFGMGLPNSSVSQARRLEAYTWTNPDCVWWSYLDVDEIRDGVLEDIPEPKRRKVPSEYGSPHTKSGTIIVWRKCDRLSLKRDSALIRRLRKELGRIFRMILWSGKNLCINGESVRPIDPLFLLPGDNLQGAKLYGDNLEYKIEDDSATGRTAGKVIARFTELPVTEWVSLSNTEKQENGISKNAGVSVLRAGREIDFGWFFMGGKRKENYDDWWRCEVEFPPQLDELFGVTHTKQGITPSEYISQLLTPDFEAIAHKLNARVRSRFMQVKGERTIPSERRAGECDRFFSPPKIIPPRSKSKDTMGGDVNAAFRFKWSTESLICPEFFIPEFKPTELKVTLNGQHPFCKRFYQPLWNSKSCDPHAIVRVLELLLFAAARAEVGLESIDAKREVAKFRRSWSDFVAAYLA